MSKLNSFVKTLNIITGKSAKHSNALRDVSDWAGTVQKLLTTYDLYGSSSPDRLLKNAGDAKFDLTGITYNGRPLIDRARSIKGQEISTLVSEIIDNVESIRRYLMNPSLQAERINQATIDLRTTYEKLQDSLANVEYM